MGLFNKKSASEAEQQVPRNPNNTVLVAKAIKFVEEITEAPETLAAKRNSMR